MKEYQTVLAVVLGIDNVVVVDNGVVDHVFVNDVDNVVFYVVVDNVVVVVVVTGVVDHTLL